MTGQKGTVKKLVAALFIGSLFVAGGAACDDNENSTNSGKIDEDDTNLGPGDGKDETGPGR